MACCTGRKSASKDASDTGPTPVVVGSYPPTGLSDTVKELPEWIKLGCGCDEYICPEKGATFPGDKCPDALPDLSKHGNIMAAGLRENPEWYDKYKDKQTKLGVTLAKCIKTGIDNPGHPHIQTCGIVAGDEESYETFKDVFDHVVSKRNGGFGPEAKHPSNMDYTQLSKTEIDPTGNYVLTTRCRTGRSVRGFPLPPACSFEQRRELEKVIIKALESMTDDLKGKYYGLCGSQSTSSPMDKDKEERLRKSGNLFQEPDSTLLLSSGCGRHWPDARGIFHNDAENFFVWCNEEDHIRIVSMQKGAAIVEIFTRFSKACAQMEEVIKKEGYAFMHNEHLGYILTCPSNLGTGLRAGAMVKVPKFSAREDFKDVLKSVKLQARGTAGVDSDSQGGVWDRLGTSEVDLCNIFIEGIANIIKWEQKLENEESVDDDVAAYQAAFKEKYPQYEC